MLQVCFPTGRDVPTSDKAQAAAKTHHCGGNISAHAANDAGRDPVANALRWSPRDPSASLGMTLK